MIHCTTGAFAMLYSRVIFEVFPVIPGYTASVEGAMAEFLFNCRGWTLLSSPLDWHMQPSMMEIHGVKYNETLIMVLILKEKTVFHVNSLGISILC